VAIERDIGARVFLDVGGAAWDSQETIRTTSIALPRDPAVHHSSRRQFTVIFQFGPDQLGNLRIDHY